MSQINDVGAQLTTVCLSFKNIFVGGFDCSLSVEAVSLSYWQQLNNFGYLPWNDTCKQENDNKKKTKQKQQIKKEKQIQNFWHTAAAGRYFTGKAVPPVIHFLHFDSTGSRHSSRSSSSSFERDAMLRMVISDEMKTFSLSLHLAGFGCRTSLKLIPFSLQFSAVGKSWVTRLHLLMNMHETCYCSALALDSPWGLFITQISFHFFSLSLPKGWTTRVQWACVCCGCLKWAGTCARTHALFEARKLPKERGEANEKKERSHEATSVCEIGNRVPLV